MMSLKQFQSDVLSIIPFCINPPAATRQETGLKVQLRQSANRRRTTAAESVVVEALSHAEEMPLETMVALLAEALYHEELHAGAWAVDVGLFGSGLFLAEARRTLKAGDGELWDIG
jgi:hypothetical protein